MNKPAPVEFQAPESDLRCPVLFWRSNRPTQRSRVFIGGLGAEVQTRFGPRVSCET